MKLLLLITILMIKVLIILKSNSQEIKLIQNSSNYGFSKAVNIGVSSSEGKFILILNPDTILKENTISELYKTLINDSNIGVVGGKILDCNGKFQLSSRRAFPSFLTSLFHVTGLSYLFPKTKLLENIIIHINQVAVLIM